MGTEKQRSDRATKVPHNTEEAGEIRSKYFKGEFVVGKGQADQSVTWRDSWSFREELRNDTHREPQRKGESMESAILRNLRPEFAPVAVIWGNTIPDDALQFKKGKFGYILYIRRN